MSLTKEQILEIRLRCEEVLVPGRAGTVRIRALSFPVLQKAGTMGDADGRYAPFVLSHCLVDDDGTPMFESEDAAAKVINDLDPAFVDFVLAYALNLSAPTKAQQADIKKALTNLAGDSSGE